MPIIEIEVDEQTASDIESLETRYCAWIRAKDSKERQSILDKGEPLVRRNPLAFFLHRHRPPSLFLDKDSKEKVIKELQQNKSLLDEFIEEDRKNKGLH